jgi:hypothetical protein
MIEITGKLLEVRMKTLSTLPRGVLFAAALLVAQFAHAQDRLVPLQARPDAGSVQIVPNSFSYHAFGLAGLRGPAPDLRPAGPLEALKISPAFEESVPVVPSPGFYAGDATNPGDGPTIVSAEFHPIYVNKPPSHWGNPARFLIDLGASEFIHVLDQYVGVIARDRYTLGASFAAQYPIPANNTLLPTDILNLVHAAAAAGGSGYGHLYHVFLPMGVDMCFPATATSPAQCYSPDNPATFDFCAFHSSATFSDSVGHVLFSVEPYQDVSGCSVPPTGSANNQLIDSTDNTLSHETSESITDPDGDAWWVHNFTILNGNEIADECIRAQVTSTGAVYWDYGNVDLNGHPYTFQPEYSDTVHGCTYRPI